MRSVNWEPGHPIVRMAIKSQDSVQIGGKSAGRAQGQGATVDLQLTSPHTTTPASPHLGRDVRTELAKNKCRGQAAPW